MTGSRLAFRFVNHAQSIRPIMRYKGLTSKFILLRGCDVD